MTLTSSIEDIREDEIDVSLDRHRKRKQPRVHYKPHFSHILEDSSPQQNGLPGLNFESTTVSSIEDRDEEMNFNYVLLKRVSAPSKDGIGYVPKLVMIPTQGS